DDRGIVYGASYVADFVCELLSGSVGHCVVGITGGLAINHYLVSDGLAFSATLAFAFPTTFGLGGLGHAILADSFILVGNFPTNHQLLSHSANRFVVELCLLAQLSVALGWIKFQQRLQNLFPFLRIEMSAMNVGADDVALGRCVTSFNK